MSKNIVLVPIETSQFSQQIVPYLQKFLDPKKNELVLLHIDPKQESIYIERPGLEPLDIYADQIEYSLRAEFAAEMKPLVQQLKECGFEVATDTLFGNPAEAIETQIDRRSVDMIAITTHGRTGLERLMVGSVAEHVLHHCHVPVMLFHPPETCYEQQVHMN